MESTLTESFLLIWLDSIVLPEIATINSLFQFGNICRHFTPIELFWSNWSVKALRCRFSDAPVYVGSFWTTAQASNVWIFPTILSFGEKCAFKNELFFIYQNTPANATKLKWTKIKNLLSSHFIAVSPECVMMLTIAMQYFIVLLFPLQYFIYRIVSAQHFFSTILIMNARKNRDNHCWLRGEWIVEMPLLWPQLFLLILGNTHTHTIF